MHGIKRYSWPDSPVIHQVGEFIREPNNLHVLRELFNETGDPAFLSHKVDEIRRVLPGMEVLSNR